jgi:predicted Zn-dependent protease
MIIRHLRILGFLAALPLGAQSAAFDTGIAHYNARRWPEAHAFFAAATKAQPKSAEAACWYGKTLMAENKPGDAEDWFEKAADLDPRSSEYQLWLARAIGMQAQRANVLRQPFLARRTKAAVDKAIALDAGNIEAREMRWQFYSMAPGIMGGGDDKAREEAAEIMRRNRYRGQFIALQMAGRAKDNAAIERSLKALVNEFPDSIAAASSYSSWLADHARVPEAFAVVDALQRRRPGDPVALYQVGRLAAVSGQQLDRGEDALRKYLTLAPPPANGIPTLSNAHFRLGNIQEKRGNNAAARAEYELALRLDGRNDLAKKALATLK